MYIVQQSLHSGRECVKRLKHTVDYLYMCITTKCYAILYKIIEGKYYTELQIFYHLFGELCTIQDFGGVCEFVISDVERWNTVANILICCHIRQNNVIANNLMPKGAATSPMRNTPK